MDPVFNLPAIGPFLGVAIVPALVAVLTHFGLPSKWAPVANFALSGAWIALAGFVVSNPEFGPLVEALLNVFVVMLAGWGFYEGTQWGQRRLAPDAA